MNRFIWLGLVVLLVAGAWTAGWLYAAGEVRNAIGRMAANDGDTAPQVACGALDITGFPFRFDVTCSDARIRDGDLSTGVTGLRASLLVYNPTHLVFSLQPPLNVSDAFTGSQSRVDFVSAEGSIRLHADDLLTGLQGEGWRLARASLLAKGIAWTDTLTGEQLLAGAEHLEAHLLDVPEQHEPARDAAALAVYANALNVTAPGMSVTGGELTLEAEVTGLPDDLRLLATDPLPRWRDAGGQLRLLSLKGTAGEDFVEATGTVGLDAAARPEGQLQIASKGLVERTGLLLPEEWKGLVLGSQAADGSYASTLNLRGGFVFAGLLPVAPLLPLF